MHRRRFIGLLGGAIALPCVAAAQQKAMPVIGFLSVFSPPTNLSEIGRGAVPQGLYQTGFVEGQNMSIERRWAEGHYDRLPAMAADLVGRKVVWRDNQGERRASIKMRRGRSVLRRREGVAQAQPRIERRRDLA